MSGPEWTIDQPERPDDARPLSRREAGPDHDPDPREGDRDRAPSFDQAHAQPPEPAMDHDLDTPDRDYPASGEPATATPTPSRPGFLATVVALVSKIPLPSLGSERHEMVLGPAPLVQPSDPPSAPSEGHAAPAPKRILGGFSPLVLRRETRVGIAAVISFVILVGSILSSRSWSGKPITLAVAGPPDGSNAEDSKAGDPKTGPEKSADGSKAEDPKAGDPKTVPETPAGGTKGEDPKPGDPKTAPETPADSPPVIPARDPGSAEPTPVPPATPDGRNPAVLGEDPLKAVPPTLPAPEEAPPKSSEPPALPPDGPEVKPEPKIEPAALPEPRIEPGPAPAMIPDLPMPGSDAKPKEAETTPPQAPASEPATLPTPVEPTPSPTAGATPAPMPMPEPVGSAEPAAKEPSTTPEPPVSAPPTTPVQPQTGPVPTDRPPTLETVPAAATVEPAAKRASAALPGAGWVALPSGGRRIIGSIPIISTPAEAQVDAPRIADGPRVVDDPAAADQIEPVVHVVQPGENFWTISRSFYRSPRFYKALHAFNRAQVPDITRLYVGTVLRIPPPEALDRSLIDPPGEAAATTTPTVSRTSNVSTGRRPQTPIAEEADLGVPARRRVVLADPEAPAPQTQRRPIYKVKAYETLRSIARDTLDDSSRAREIYNLNRDVLDDPNEPPPVGTILTLPADAVLGRRSK